MKPDTESDMPVNDGSTHATNTPDPASIDDGDQGMIPHAVASARAAASDVAQGVKAAVSDAVAWTEAKVEKLSAKKEDGVGPYGSLSTCAPSDLDPIAQGVLPGLPTDKKEVEVQTREVENEDPGDGGVVEEKREGEKKDE